MIVRGTGLSGPVPDPPTRSYDSNDHVAPVFVRSGWRGCDVNSRTIYRDLAVEIPIA